MKNCFALLVSVGLFLFVATVAQADLFMSVSGKVVAADNGAPLSGVTLRLISPDKGKIAEAKSNALGVFIIRDVRKGDYSVWAVSDDPFIVSSNTTVQVTVPDGKNVVGIGIKMQRGGAIRGRILTSTGGAVPQASILGPGGLSATTDASGNFVIRGATVGAVDLAVIAPQIAVKSFKATSIAGKYTEVGSIILPVGTDSVLKGTVTDISGDPVSGAILIASAGIGSGAYTMGLDNGSFAMTGLDKTKKYKLDIIVYGYEPLSLTEVSVPTINLAIVLKPVQQKASSLLQYRYNSGKSDVEIMYTEMIIPAAYRTCSKGNCPEGIWYGYSADLTGILIPINVFTELGGSFSIGRYRCSSSLSKLDFSSFCKYVAVTTNFVSVGVGSIGYRCTKACCGEDLLGSSNGFVGMLSAGLRGTAGGVDFSGGTYCFTWSAGLGIDVPISGSLPISGVVAYRNCDTFEQVNVFEYYLR